MRTPLDFRAFLFFYLSLSRRVFKVYRIYRVIGLAAFMATLFFFSFLGWGGGGGGVDLHFGPFGGLLQKTFFIVPSTRQDP